MLASNIVSPLLDGGSIRFIINKNTTQDMM